MTFGTAQIGSTSRYRTSIMVSGHAITADEPRALGGQGVGPAPYDLLLASLGACTAITLRMYAERKGWHLELLEVSMRLVGTDALRIERTLVMKGLEESQRLRMAEIAERTPVTKMLRSGLPIDTRLA